MFSFKNHAENEVERLVPGFFDFKKALYEKFFSCYILLNDQI